MLVFKLLLSPKEERNKIHKKEAKKMQIQEYVYVHCINFLGLRNNCGFIYTCVLNFILNLKWKTKVNGPGATTNVHLFT